MAFILCLCITGNTIVAQSFVAEEQPARYKTLDQTFLDYQIIETPQELAIACEQIAQGKFLAIDTEFERRRTFYAKLSLVTIYCGHTTFVIDAIKLKNLEVLYEVIKNNSCIKILHGCREDIEIFYHQGNFELQPVFDTQVAAEFWGDKKSLSYEKLVEGILKKKINKVDSY